MLSFNLGLKVFVAPEPVDLRKSFSGQEGLVGERLGEELRAGALVVVTNRRHSQLKIMSCQPHKEAETGTTLNPKLLQCSRLENRRPPFILPRFSGPKLRDKQRWHPSSCPMPI